MDNLLRLVKGGVNGANEAAKDAVKSAPSKLAPLTNWFKANKIATAIIVVLLVLTIAGWIHNPAAAAAVAAVTTTTPAAFKSNFQEFNYGGDLYSDVPYSTLPNGIHISGSGDAMYGASAAFQDGRAITGHHSTPLIECPAECYDICAGVDPNKPLSNPADLTGKRAIDSSIQEIDSQLVYSSFTDCPSHETMYERFADAVQTNIVNKVAGLAPPGNAPPIVTADDTLPLGLGSCSDREEEKDLRPTSDEFLIRRWGGRLL